MLTSSKKLKLGNFTEAFLLSGKLENYQNQGNTHKILKSAFIHRRNANTYLQIAKYFKDESCNANCQTDEPRRVNLVQNSVLECDWYLYIVT